MRVSTLCAALALASASIGLAYAGPVDLITNGNFAAPGITVSTQFGTAFYNGSSSHQFITDWLGNDGYALWFPNAGAATTEDAIGQYTYTGKEKLYGVTGASGTIPNPPNGTSSTPFVGLDGDQVAGVQASIGQTISGLTIGKTYTVTFDWGAAQVQSRSGETHSSIQVNFGSLLVGSTGMTTNPSESFTGWMTSKMSFVADSSSGFLNFLAVGTPGGLPPMSVLSNVAMTASVPEPPALALFGGGLLGLGLLTVVARRRAERRNEEA